MNVICEINIGFHFVFALKIQQIIQQQKTQVTVGALSKAHPLKTKNKDRDALPTMHIGMKTERIEK